MIRSLLLASAMTVVAGAAFAADLPDTKGAPVYAPPLIPVFSWTGFLYRRQCRRFRNVKLFEHFLHER